MKKTLLAFSAVSLLLLACGGSDSDDAASTGAGGSSSAGAGGSSAGAGGSSAGAGGAAAGTAGASSTSLVGKWSLAPQMMPAPAVQTFSQTWEFFATGKATRVDTYVYSKTFTEMEAGCTQVNTITDLVWATKGADITVDGGQMATEYSGCNDPKQNGAKPATPTNLMMTGTWSIAGDKLTLTLQGDTAVFDRVK